MRKLLCKWFNLVKEEGHLMVKAELMKDILMFISDDPNQRVVVESRYRFRALISNMIWSGEGENGVWDGILTNEEEFEK